MEGRVWVILVVVVLVLVLLYMSVPLGPNYPRLFLVTLLSLPDSPGSYVEKGGGLPLFHTSYTFYTTCTCENNYENMTPLNINILIVWKEG